MCICQKKYGNVKVFHADTEPFYPGEYNGEREKQVKYKTNNCKLW